MPLISEKNFDYAICEDTRLVSALFLTPSEDHEA